MRPLDPKSTVDASTEVERAHVRDERPVLPRLDEQRFVFGDERARGGIGKILEARDEVLGRRIAVKQLLRSDRPHESVRFVREALLTARLQHPAIVPIYDAGLRASGEPYYAMPLVPGGSLHAAIGAAGALDGRLALLPRVQAVVDAIAYAHGEGVVHRDLKPANVLVGEFGETVVIDWGLAKDTRAAAGEESGEGVPSSVDLPVDATQTGAVLGTPSYMAPEQARGEAVGARADVYAIGAILYHLLSGRVPYAGTTGGVLLGPPPPLESIEPGVPRDLVSIVTKAMARQPDRRYASARELAADLRRFATGQLVGARRYSLWALLRRWLGRHRVTVSITAALLTLLAVTAVVSASRVLYERDRAETENNRLRLLQGEALVDHDPTAAAAWLASYRVEPEARERAVALAARAAGAGVARWALTLPDESPMRVCLAPDGQHAVILGRSGAIWSFDLRAATRQRLGTLGALPSGCGFRADGRFFFSMARGAALTVGGLEGVAPWLPELPALASHVEWGDDGRLVATTTDGRVLLVDPVGRTVVAPAGLPAHAIRAVLARDGGSLFVGDAQGGVWQATLDGTPARLMQRLDGPAYSFALRRDGRALVLGTDRAAIVLDVATGTTTVRQIATTTGDPVHARPAGDGVMMISAVDQTVELWRPGADDAATTRFGDRAFWKTLVISADGERAAWTNVDGSLYVADLAQHVARAFIGHPSAVRSIDLTPDGRWMATAHGDRVRIFALGEPTRRAWQIPGGASAIHQVLRKRPGEILYAEEGGRRLVIFDTRTRTRRVVATLDEPARCSGSLPSGHEVAIGGERGAMSIVDLDSGVVRPLERLGSRCHVVQVLGDVLHAGDADLRTYAWDLATWKLTVHPPRDPSLSQLLPRIEKPGPRVAVLLESVALIVDTATDQLQALRVRGGLFFGGALSKDENSAVFGTSDGRLLHWRVGDAEPRELGRLDGLVTHMTFSRDGREVYAGAESGVVEAFSVQDGTRRPIGRHGARITAFTLSRSGARLASGDVTGEIRVFEPATGAALVLAGHEQTILWVAFVDDDLLVSMNYTGQLRLWPLTTSLFVPGDGPSLRAWLAELTTAQVTGAAGAVESPMTTLAALP